jgi:hypothetical protein
MRENTSGWRPSEQAYFSFLPLSSMIHGQKFWGLRVAAAFWITVIFMILLRFG